MPVSRLSRRFHKDFRSGQVGACAQSLCPGQVLFWHRRPFHDRCCGNTWRHDERHAYRTHNRESQRTLESHDKQSHRTCDHDNRRRGDERWIFIPEGTGHVQRRRHEGRWCVNQNRNRGIGA
jgi:hypothetical protein